MVDTGEDGTRSREALLSDRRKPNRQDLRNRHSIALLRAQRAADPRFTEAEATPVAQPDLVSAPDQSDDGSNGLTTARGLVYGLLFGSAIWALIVLLWWLM